MAFADLTIKHTNEAGSQPELVIRGGLALTMTQDPGLIPDARVFVSGGRITAIGSAEDLRFAGALEAEMIDATDCIILPGLVNAHTHAAMTLFRGLADDLPLHQWLSEKIFPAENTYLDEETVYQGTLLACLEMIASGTTCMADGYFFQDGTVRAVHEAGLRGLLAQGIIDFPAPGVPDPKKNVETGKKFIEKWRDFSPLIIPGVFCHSPVTCSSETLTRAMEVSRLYEVPLQIHLSETSEEVSQIRSRSGKRPGHYLDQLDLLNPSLIAAHGIHLDENEIALMAARGVKVVHVPESNMKLGSGTARVTDMLKRGMIVGLGTDGACSNNDLDLFLEMDNAAKLAKLTDMDPTSLSALDTLRMATVGGASVLGLQDEIGTLEAGKRADIITVDLKHPHLCPLHHPASTLVYAANGSDVKDVVVDGKVLMKNRSLTTLDPIAIMARVNQIAKNIRS